MRRSSKPSDEEREPSFKSDDEKLSSSNDEEEQSSFKSSNEKQSPFKSSNEEQSPLKSSNEEQSSCKSSDEKQSSCKSSNEKESSVNYGVKQTVDQILEKFEHAFAKNPQIITKSENDFLEKRKNFIHDFEKLSKAQILQLFYHLQQQNLLRKKSDDRKFEIDSKMKFEEIFFLVDKSSKKIKVMKEIDLSLTESIKDSEIRIISGLPPHPNVMRPEVFDFEKKDNFCECKMTMPSFEFDFLSFLFDEQDKNPNPSKICPENCKRNLSNVRFVLREALTGLEHLHKHGIIHFDMKFGAVLINPRENQVVLIDFGQSKYSSDLVCTGTAEAGTKGFLSPEQIKYNQFLKPKSQEEKDDLRHEDLENLNLTTKSDIYSFGMMLYYLFAGKFGENEEIIKETVKKLDPEAVRSRIGEYYEKNSNSGTFLDENILQDICEVIKLCLKEEPNERPSATTLLNEHIFFSETPNQEFNESKKPPNQGNTASYSTCEMMLIKIFKKEAELFDISKEIIKTRIAELFQNDENSGSSEVIMVYFKEVLHSLDLNSNTPHTFGPIETTPTEDNEEKKVEIEMFCNKSTLGELQADDDNVQKTTSKEENLIKEQYKLFAEVQNDIPIVKNNKKRIITAMEDLEQAGILAGGTFFDKYELFENELFKDPEANLYKVVEKSDNTIKAVRRKKFDLTERLDVSREMQFFAKIRHENVVKVEKIFFEQGNDDEFFIMNMVMPWIDDTLLSLMLGKENIEGLSHTQIGKCKIQISFSEMKIILKEILMGICAIHSNMMIHMDLKFENILVEKRVAGKGCGEIGENWRKKISYHPKIIDFGLAQHMYSLTTIIGGTPGFFAPEIQKHMIFGDLSSLLLGDDEDDGVEVKAGERARYFTPKVDIYSFGVMLYRIFIQETENIEKSNIKNQRIRQRISEIFPKDDTISDGIIDDIENILLVCLKEVASNRPNASDLLFDHPFFNDNATCCPKIQSLMDEEFETALNHLEGKNGFVKDSHKAREIFEKIASSDKEWKVPATFAFGWMNYHGFGGTIDEKKGIQMMKRSGIEALQYFECHLHEDKTGFFHLFIGMIYCSGADGIQPDFAIAQDHFVKSTEKLNSFAYFMLGNNYHHGYGVSQDDSKAFEFYKLSSDLQNCAGQNSLGLMYLNGCGTKQDQVFATKLFQLSANQGYHLGQYNLSEVYSYGKGVTMDKVKANQYLKLAADNGNASAQFDYATNCLEGKDIEKNLFLAKEYFTRAAAQGQEDASKQLKNHEIVFEKLPKTEIQPIDEDFEKVDGKDGLSGNLKKIDG